MIDVRNVTKRYGKFTALENLNLKVEKSSIYGLVGYNGAGKTTLLKTMMGIYNPDKGKVLVDGENVYDNALIRQTMVMIPDEIYFFPQASIADMSEFYRGFYPRWSDTIERKLVKVFGLNDKERILRFSKGMQRQVAIILALSTRPSYLLLDELFDGLDPVIRNTVRRLILETIAGTETTIIISSHNLRELEDLCDHIGIINNRHIVYDNSIEALRVQKTRYRVVLPQDASTADFTAISTKDIVRTGQVVTFVARESEADVDDKLRAHNPLLVEKYPLTLEELFLDEMEVKDYDFSGLFDEE
ncbi:MAG: ABC transporter ATP-binding protein [Ruminococcaceae bacterium]|nr:ABC transporter ATP-binding protein [Oscillospiraceae bacterium]